ncbi:Cell division protein FtsQ [Burkholderiales bacterium]|nr:Cell division protein FtsQ [Burkholderiales bacterium]
MSTVAVLRWMTRALLGSALTLALGAAVFWVAQRPRFDFRRIEVAGDLRHVSRAAIRGAIAGRLAGSFFTMRLADSRAAFETIPWVASASVRRVWPDRLVVHLVERRAVGTWSDGRVLSDAGLLFDANPAEAELDGPQVEFSGPPRFAAEAADKLRAFAAALGSLSTTVVAVAVSDRASWTIRTASGQTLALGRDDPPGSVQGRLAAIVANYPTVVAQLSGPPAHIDARYNNGFAVTRP